LFFFSVDGDFSLRHVRRLLRREEVVVAGVRGESVFVGIGLRLFVVRLFTPVDETEEFDLVVVEERLSALRNRSLKVILRLIQNDDLFSTVG